MSNEIQLALGQGQNLARQSQWSGGPLGASGAPQPNAFKAVHRALRGRYILAGCLAAVFAVAFAAAGFMVSKPAYKSSAQIEIDPLVPLPGEPVDKVMAMQNLFIQSEMVKLKSERVVRAAMDDIRWKTARSKPAPDALQKFLTNLSIDQPPHASNFITVTYTDNAKDAKAVVQTAVACVMKSFRDIYGQEDSKGIDERIAALNLEFNESSLKIERLEAENKELGKDGADDTDVIKAHDEICIKTLATINDAKELLSEARDNLAEAQKSGTDAKISIEDFARVDLEMANQLKARGEDQMHYEALLQTLGPRNPAVVTARTAFETRTTHMQAYADQLNARFVIRWRIDGTGGVLISRDLSSQEKAIQRQTELYDKEFALVSNMRSRFQTIVSKRTQIADLKLRQNQVLEQLRVDNYVREHAVHTKYLDEEGTEAALDKDRRPVIAAIGFMGGAGLPIGIMLLIGMFDSRYRYSDEASTGHGQLTLLGILPNLPDRLSDPEQAGIAAHCVHQIRTMLQINGAMEERRVIAVTSASPGDGKTSLTLALGLSYAACGTRTLLIDCDLIGAGLTARMNVSAAEGVLEAIANRTLLPYVRTTDISDVAILPVGSAGTLHASTLSPQALRRLVEEAEKHFDTVLIDTGPVLGSIEASLVCAAADAVILAVSRGQQRPMVEKSLSHLTAIGAKLAGVVFNRAQAHDFERSISGVSMRQVGAPVLSRSRAVQAAAARARQDASDMQADDPDHQD